MVARALPLTPPHLRLTADQLREQYQAGILKARAYLLYLIRSLRKDGYILRIPNVIQFCQEWGLARRTFYRVKSQLVAAGLLNAQIRGSLDLQIIPPGLPASSLDKCATFGSWGATTGIECATFGADTPLDPSLQGDPRDPPDLLTDLDQISSLERDFESLEDQAQNPSFREPVIPGDPQIHKHLRGAETGTGSDPPMIPPPPDPSAEFGSRQSLYKEKPRVRSLRELPESLIQELRELNIRIDRRLRKALSPYTDQEILAQAERQRERRDGPGKPIRDPALYFVNGLKLKAQEQKQQRIKDPESTQAMVAGMMAVPKSPPPQGFLENTRSLLQRMAGKPDPGGGSS